MSISKSILVAAGLSLALAAGVSAQSLNTDVSDGIAMIITAEGKMVPLGGRMTKVNATGHKMLMQHATPIKAGTILYRSGNTYYMLENKMVDGKMVEDHAKGWVGGGGN